MGYPKWKLPMGEFTLLEYIVQQLANVASRIVCVGLPPNTLELPNVQFIADEQPGHGPLEGIRVGLKSVAEQHDYAYVTACDSPFPQANVIQYLQQQIADHESALPASATHVYGLSGLYRTDTHVKIADLVDSNQLRVSGLATALDSKLIPFEQILNVDPGTQVRLQRKSTGRVLGFDRTT